MVKLTEEEAEAIATTAANVFYRSMVAQGIAPTEEMARAQGCALKMAFIKHGLLGKEAVQ